MILRYYRKEDAAVICKWIRTEEDLYKWSADRYNKFPLLENDIDDSYSAQLRNGRFFPLTATDDDGNVVGHFIIRYPREDDNSSVRFGFVIVDPDIRGKGYGREMLRLGIQYAKEKLKASRIDLGVFDNNAGAIHCYEAAGFKAYDQMPFECKTGTWNCIQMELLLNG